MKPRRKGWGRKPCPALVTRIAAEEAAKTGAVLSEVLGPTQRHPALRARKAAWIRIMETGCSMNGLADVWGADRQSIRRTLIQHADLRRAA